MSWATGSRTPEYGQIMEDEGLMNKEASELDSSYRTLQAKHRTLKRWFTALTLLLSLALAALLAMVWNASIENDNTSSLSPVPSCTSQPSSCRAYTS